MESLDPRPYLLINKIQPYAWGTRGTEAFIPRLLGIEAEPDTPYAELWMGAHPKAPSEVIIDGSRVSLCQLIARYPREILGQVDRREDDGSPPTIELDYQPHPTIEELVVAVMEATLAQLPAPVTQESSGHRTLEDRHGERRSQLVARIRYLLLYPRILSVHNGTAQCNLSCHSHDRSLYCASLLVGHEKIRDPLGGFWINTQEIGPIFVLWRASLYDCASRIHPPTEQPCVL